MVDTIEQKYEELVIEISDDDVTYNKICGMDGYTVSRSAQVDSTEIPDDCDDESKPHRVVRSVRSKEMSISGTGVWAQQSNNTISDWYHDGAEKFVRVGHLNAAVGDVEYEKGPALLTQLDNQRQKGQAVSANITIHFWPIADLHCLFHTPAY